MCIPAGLPGFESCAKPEDDQPEDFGPGSSTLLFVPELLVQLRSNDVGMGECLAHGSLLAVERPRTRNVA